MLTVKERVKSGVKRLRDSGYVTWYRDVNVNKLDMSCSLTSILGQLYTTEMRSGWAIGTRLLYGEVSNRIAEATADGFCSLFQHEGEELKAEWVKTIKAAKEALPCEA